MQVIAEKQTKGLNGTLITPPDKSINHRAVMFSVLTKGQVRISNFLNGADCLSSLRIIEQLGCTIEFKSESELIINAQNALKTPLGNLDCGNSGTTMRLMSGILAGQHFNSTMIGDISLSKRPMKRVIEPLAMMGAIIEHNEYKAPLSFTASNLKGIIYNSKLSSAQVKSCILLAGLFAQGETVYEESCKSRNHTELMLEYLGANINVEQNKVVIKQSKLEPKDIAVVGDISSAAFFMVAALIVPNSSITIKNVGLNPTRTGIIDVLKQMGADITILDEKIICKEPVGDIKVKYSQLKAITIEKDLIPRLIDELPVIAVLATQAHGTTIIKNAEDLKNKESDRIKCLVTELKKLGVNIEETKDGFIVEGKTKLNGGVEVECYHDHRLAMSLFVAGLICEKPIQINEFQWVDISFPDFLKQMHNLFQ